MPPKRKRRVSTTSKGLAPGQQLKRSTLPGNNSSYWGWVGTEVTRASDITPEHLLISCGLSERNNHPFCPNKYCLTPPKVLEVEDNHKALSADGELDDDVIIISDDELPLCNCKNCKSNPNCLNYLGQEEWEDEGGVMEIFLKTVMVEDNPCLETREPDFPVGLKNLGATCYANASLQVWFRDLAFRTGVYGCTPCDESNSKFKESPIFQLQVTFTALQESIQNCFNPLKLVESLQLRTSEQQDAQEFSKLFMSHLDAEFKKQASPKVKSIVTDQFQGKQVYGTICSKCQYKSERVSDFLEIEINLKNNSRLEERIEAVLHPETLSGDNQYLCSQCESLQDATRYIELKELPPVLHFSLLRFVYDLSTMERKKSKHSLSFPTTLDMNPFLGRNDQKRSEASTIDKNVYDLRGVLLHKGSSAYHGHYEAQVYDLTHKSWFQFNDETVTKLKALGETLKFNKPIVVDIEDSDERASTSLGRKNRMNARKRRRVDSDEEIEKSFSNNIQLISSKDAYMLIYARRIYHSSPLTTYASPIPHPPPDALVVVNALNAVHDEACEQYDVKQNLLKAVFQQRRRKVMDIYRRWNVESTNTDSILVSRQALSGWLSQHRDKSIPTLSAPGSDEKTERKCIPLDDITCAHMAVDPNKANNIKRISRQAYLDIVKDTSWDFEPRFTTANICVDCVQCSFKERLYQIEHPQLVAQFDQISEVDVDHVGFWISKPWIKDWRLSKPKMHVVSESDPAPDFADFASDVLCEHGALSLNATSRRRISAEAAELLQNIFPSWNPLSANLELCPVCDASIHISKESKREVRKQAEDEKARLKCLYEALQSGDTAVPEDGLCALIPDRFAKDWKQWLNRPTDCPRPNEIDNTSFLCDHDILVLDPNAPADLEGSAVCIRRSDWDILETMYPSGPLIAVERQTQVGSVLSKYSSELPVCEDCRMKCKTAWITAEIVIHLNRAKQKPAMKLNGEKPLNKALVTHLKSGPRQSRRLRQIKEIGEKRRFTISKSTTVKEIKIMVQDELNIPTICQRLFHRGRELDDNAATVESLDIFARDILELKQENEVVDLDSDTDAAENRPQGEERGFGGTLLGGSGFIDTLSSSPPSRVGEKPCSACTYSNGADALKCTICDTLFT